MPQFPRRPLLGSSVNKAHCCPLLVVTSSASPSGADLAYHVATLVAIWSPYGALTLYGVITLFYLLPLGKLDRLLVRHISVSQSRRYL
jgi:hypothetical protein